MRDSWAGPAPLFIVLEGIDGAGTTTQAERLITTLANHERRAHATREPSQGPIGRLLREALLGGPRSPEGAPLDGDAMALLCAADRRDHLRRAVEPALRGGQDVVSDRYLLSSLAYQAEEADRGWVELLARGIRTPDLTILLDLPVATAAARRRAAGRITERYDDDQTQNRVATNYRQLAQTFAGVVVLDGSGDIDAVTRAISDTVAALIERRRGTSA
ncbi:MAG TPA: dTMP kinase [Polyangia bacterium]